MALSITTAEAGDWLAASRARICIGLSLKMKTARTTHIAPGSIAPSP
jgi:hypothetical protein